MKKTYYAIETDNWCDYGIKTSPKLPMSIGFFRGEMINQEELPALNFSMNFPRNESLPHLLGDVIPLVSPEFLEIIKLQKINNFQVFPAKITNSEIDYTIRNYYAFNVLGVVAAADMNTSKFDTIMEGDDEGVETPLVLFKEVALQKDKVLGFDLFRLAEQPSKIICSNRIVDALTDNRPEDGWGIDAIEVDLT